MSLQINKFFLILLLTGLSSTFAQLGIMFKIDFLKYLSAPLLLIVIFISLVRIVRYFYFFNSKNVLFLIILFVYPMFQILSELINSFSLKIFTDGFIIKGGYYHLIIISLALMTFINSTNILEQLKKYILFSSPLTILLIILCYSSPIELSINISYLLFTNFLIPGSLLILFKLEKLYFYLGWFSISSLVFISSYVGSRSYTLVALYILIAFFYIKFKTNKKSFFLVLFTMMGLYFSDAFSFFTKGASVKGESISERMSFDSLSTTFNKFFETFDFWVLFKWDGNSRATILFDAFHNFDVINLLFGKGMFATYHSFVERSTIELHWAQETFRLGLLYTVFTLVIFLIARNNINKITFPLNQGFLQVLSVLILVKILDAFIYGMPDNSIYNLLVFMGVMSLGLKKRNNIVTKTN